MAITSCHERGSNLLTPDGRDSTLITQLIQLASSGRIARPARREKVLQYVDHCCLLRQKNGTFSQWRVWASSKTSAHFFDSFKQGINYLEITKKPIATWLLLLLSLAPAVVVSVSVEIQHWPSRLSRISWGLKVNGYSSLDIRWRWRRFSWKVKKKVKMTFWIFCFIIPFVLWRDKNIWPRIKLVMKPLRLPHKFFFKSVFVFFHL